MEPELSPNSAESPITIPSLTGIDDPFVYVAPTTKSIKHIQIIRTECRILQIKIYALVPASRERSLALTKLEEVSMWANKAIVFHQ